MKFQKIYGLVLLIPFIWGCSIDPAEELVPAFTFSVVDDTVYLFNQSEGYVSHIWEFGDGKTSTQENPKHGYKSTGQYNVTLRIRIPNEDDTRPNEHLYQSFTPIVERNKPHEKQVSQTVIIGYSHPVSPVINEEFSIGFSFFTPNIEFTRNVNGQVYSDFELALDKQFTQPVSAVHDGKGAFTGSTRLGTAPPPGSFVIKQLKPETNYFYRIKNLVTPPSGGATNTFYSTTKMVTTAKFPVATIKHRKNDGIYTRYSIKWDVEDPYDEVAVDSVEALDPSFNNPIEPEVDFQMLGETHYVRVQYNLSYDSTNYNGEVIESYQNDNLYLGIWYDDPNNPFTGDDTKVSESNGIIDVELGTKSAEKIQFHLTASEQDKFYFIKSGAEDVGSNYIIYYDTEGRKYLAADIANLYVFYTKIPGTDFTLCELRDENHKDIILLRSVDTGELLTFKGFLFRMDL